LGGGVGVLFNKLFGMFSERGWASFGGGFAFRCQFEWALAFDGVASVRRGAVRVRVCARVRSLHVAV